MKQLKGITNLDDDAFLEIAGADTMAWYQAPAHLAELKQHNEEITN